MPKPCRPAIRDRIWIFLSLMLLMGQLRAQPPKRASTDSELMITVCELMRAPQRFRGKVITLKGIYWYGLRQQCPEPLITGGHAWPSAVNLADSSATSERRVFFVTDQDAWDNLDRTVLREAQAGKREEIWVTMTGELRAPESYVRSDGTVVGGYGHLGVYPAELVVKSVDDVRIRPVPTFNYADLLGGATARRSPRR